MIDAQCRLDTGLDLDQTSGVTVYSENGYNLGSTKDPGGGRPLYVVISISEAVTSADSTATVIFAIVDEDDEDIDTDSVEILQTDPIVCTRLTLGKVIVIPIPFGLITKQYIGLRATIGTQDTDSGIAIVDIGIDAFTNPGA